MAITAAQPTDTRIARHILGQSYFKGGYLIGSMYLYQWKCKRNLISATWIYFP